MKSLLRKLRLAAKRETPMTWFRKAASVLLAVSYLLALFAVVGAQILPWWYLAGIALLTAPLVVWAVISGFAKPLSARRGVALAVGSVIAAIMCLCAYANIHATTSFLDSLQAGEYEYIDYSIVAKKDQRIQLSASTHQAVGLLSIDDNKEPVKAAAREHTNACFRLYDDIASLTVALDDQDITTATLSSKHLSLLKENYNDFYQTLDILATFTVKIPKQSSTITVDTTKPFVVYISGIDTYGEISAVARSDVNILAVVNPQTHKVLLINTPRDYYVQLHGTTGTRDKLTHAGIYGIDMSMQTLQDLYGTDISYYLRINFASLTKIVNALGGVDVNSEYEFKAGKYSFQKGYNHLDGDAALAFSRERYSFEAGDRTRGQNQQRVIEAIIHKLATPQALVNYTHILNAMQGSMQTNATASDITSMVNRQLSDLASWQVESISVDGTGKRDYTYSMGNIELYVMEPDTATVNAAKQKIQQYLGTDSN